MRTRFGILLAILSIVAFAAGQTSAPVKAARPATPSAAGSQAPGSGTLPRPSPTPISPKLNPGVAPAPISTGPQYSPAQLDFGSLWDGESAKRTLTLTPPLGGIVTVSFPGGGLFWLTEYRVVGPFSGGSKNTPTSMRQNGPTSQWQIKTRSTLPVGKSIPGYYPASVSAGDQIQVDIVFQPISHPNGTTLVVPPGPKSIVIGIIGPGLTRSWSVQIPARGVFNGSRSQ